MNKMKAISLFSGMGGDSLAIKNCGINLTHYSEKEKKFCKTHDLNFDSKLISNGDILKTSDEDILNIIKEEGNIDLVFAGFPCQGFSNAGKKLPDDPRNTLFREFLRVTKLIKPKYIIGENVKGLMSRKTATGENYIDVIVSEFEKLNYIVSYKVMKAHNYGVPQKRERLIIVGVLNGPQFEFPNELNTTTNLLDIVKFDMTGAIKINKDNPNYYLFDTIPKECILTNNKNKEDINKPHPNLKLLAEDVDYEYGGKVFPNRLSFGKRDSSIHGEIIDIRNPCKTIICTYARQPRLFVPLKNKNGYYLRCLLPDELKQIQGFPKDFKLEGNVSDQIVMIGNAVPPPLIELIIKKLVS